MTKPSSARKSGYRCTECGATAPQWVGRCGECQAWGSVEQVGGARVTAAVTPGAVSAPARPIGELDPELARARPTGVGELDRVLGGGLVPGSVVLLAGEPGVGKSTLLLEVAHKFAVTGGTALIVTGEESPAQVRMRAERTGSLHRNLFLAAENDLGAVLTHVDAVKPGLLVVDSVQTISTDSVDANRHHAHSVGSSKRTVVTQVYPFRSMVFRSGSADRPITGAKARATHWLCMIPG